jgi:hypothetical protein
MQTLTSSMTDNINSPPDKHVQWSCILHYNALPHLAQQAAKHFYALVLGLDDTFS